MCYMSVMTIRLDPKLRRLLGQASRQTGLSRSDVVRDALRRQLAIQRFDQLRQRIAPAAGRKGFITDEDVFARVS
jgi:predicted transcriptional regulator